MSALTAHVRVTSPEGTDAWFGPGDDVPDWARTQITNPRALADPIPEPDPEPSGKTVRSKKTP